MQRILALFVTLGLCAPLRAEEPWPKDPPLHGPATGSSREQVLAQASAFFSRLLVGDSRGLAKRSAFPFQLETHRVDSEDALVAEWSHHLRAKHLDSLILQGIEVFTPEEMEQRFGPPPPRLSALPWKGPKTWIAVASLSGHSAVAVYKDLGRGFQVVGFTD